MDIIGKVRNDFGSPFVALNFAAYKPTHKPDRIEVLFVHCGSGLRTHFLYSRQNRRELRLQRSSIHFIF